ncbi:MAG: hypothetical protein DMG41_01405 [Acidobacteria bacterium]|nr:MAG: hypothetical protein DMG41_01405 [Acidobacteriota bacterium]
MNAATAPTPFPVVRPADLSTAPASSAPWLIDQLWTAHAVGIIGGTPKSYKTWMALEMAVSVASGSACLTTFAVPSPGPVLLYAAEDSQATLRLRLESLAQHPALRWLAWTFASSPRILCAWTASPTNSGLRPLSCFTAPFFSSSTPWSACMPSTKTPPARLRHCSAISVCCNARAARRLRWCIIAAKMSLPRVEPATVQKFAKEMQKPIEAIPTAVMKGLRTWDWPGNIRELENFIERAVILTRGKSLEAPLAELRKTNTEAFVHTDLHEVKPVAGERANSPNDKSSAANEYKGKQRDQIIRALTACKGRVGGADGAAARLGMNRTTLLSRMKKLGIYAKQYA